MEGCPLSETAKYDSLREACRNCGKKEECKMDKVTGKEKKVDEIKQLVRDSLTIKAEELVNYRGCMKTINTVIDEYHKAGLRRKKDHKARKYTVQEEVKKMGKLPVTDSKLDLLISYAEYIFFGE